MQLRNLIEIMERIAPIKHAESWDNVGLLAGDPDQEITSILLTIDYTREVAEEAKKLRCDAIIAYHPPIFHPLKRLVAGSLIFDAIRRGVAIYSPHTALDVAIGGTNDVLCDVLGLENRSPLKVSQPKTARCKLVTFAPESAVEKVSAALFGAGAGRIGKYSSCSFRSPGTGTFFGEEGTNPAVGKSGKLELAPEVRLETIVPLHLVSAVTAALKKSHPYEEPAFDLNQLSEPPDGLGIGRAGTFATPVDRAELFQQLKAGLGLEHLLIAGPESGSVTRAAVCAGACGDLLDEAISQKAEFYVTGEMRHHDAIKASAAGLTVVCTLHSNSERLTLKVLRSRLAAELPGLALHQSQADRDPFSIR
jgi:dinuclear metal center YbgI/SA1388 family protein